MKPTGRIGLALSGGGVRAAAFHAGVLKWLAETKEIEKVMYISTVSGGSLVAGLIFQSNGLRWPNSRQYLDSVLPCVRAILTEHSLQCTALRNLFFRPVNWKYVFSRANVLAKTIESLWKVGAQLSQLHAPPIWVLNGTTGETGVRFAIRGAMLGDYETGYTRVPQMKLAVAMAISAAFPVGIGPVTLRTSGLKWVRGKNVQSDKLWSLPSRKLHVYDGGLYDNLGIESLFDVGRQAIKTAAEAEVDRIIVSDASPELHRGAIPFFLSPLRLKRLMDITLSQVKKLRVRSFVNFMENHPACGEYVQMGQHAVSAIERLGSPKSNTTKALLKMRWIPADEVEKAANYPTTLRMMKPADFDLLSQHGYETAKWNAILWGDKKKTSPVRADAQST